MKIGYARVSTYQQHEDRQVEMLKDKVDKIFVDKVTGSNTERPYLQEMLVFIRENDVVYIESISRLARSTKDFLRLMDTFKEKRVYLICLKEPIDTTTAHGKFVMTIFAAMYEMELANIKERQKEGIAVAKKKGIRFGRPRKDPKNFDHFYKQWKDGNITATFAMRSIGLSHTSWYRKVKEKEKAAE